MDRRSFLSGAITVAALAPAGADAAEPPALRGAVDARARGLTPDIPSNQGRLLQAILQEAAAENRPVFLPPGSYAVSNIVLPSNTRLLGIAGATRLIFAGDGHMINAEGAALVTLDGLVIDGAGLPLADYVEGVVHLVDCGTVRVRDCDVTASAKNGLALDRCGGRVEANRIIDAKLAAIRAIESTGLTLAGNDVADCGNGGVLVWRWSEGEDGTIVTGNRIARIGAADGGTGENGNGINVFRAHGVIVASNHISDCAFTAVRANAADNVQITGNTCLRSGEVAVFSEFGFSGALIANNIIETAATGISVANFDAGGRMAVVANNIVRDLVDEGPYPADEQGFGVGISVEADVTVSGNVIDGAPRFGLVLGWGPYLRDVAATGNVIRDAPVGIAVSVVEGAGAVLINDNLISGAGQGAIVGMRWAERASGDLALSGAEEFPHVTIARNRA
ncbi:MAG: TIGR03808 family TAT-translocated repetitive protein [Bauldia sp.]|uniref:TIGR03808 family TAT-translocated repetitive protein n=1 Tax=Bauldia sp. TaxID=2575872 RepID=UPI001D84A6EF|nr:TIGR03808 family TAT-translocated repetitive protein [Bauldia sp.]MCB1497922.1 TIGR03808 family TAT-translocated repetitive protein [Bauldia sp.]